MNPRLFAGILLVLGAAHALAAPLTKGNLVLSTIGGTTSAAASINFLEFSPNGAFPLGTALQTITAPTTGANALTNSGAAELNGGISGIHGGNGLFFTGYNADAGTANVNGSTATARVARLDYATGLITGQNLAPGSYSNHIRFASSAPDGGLPPGGRFLASGAGTGVSGGARRGGFGSPATTLDSGTATDVRASYVRTNNWAFFTTATTLSIGLNDSPGSTPFDLLNEPGADFNDFQYFVAEGVNNFAVYIADGRAGAQGGLSKYSLINNAYTKMYTINLPGLTGTVGARQFTASEIDANGVATFYAVGTNNELYTFTDNTRPSNTTFTGTATSIFTAPTGTVLRGVEVVPEPASMAALALGFGAIVARRRK